MTQHAVSDAWLFDLGNTRLKCAALSTDGAPGEVRVLSSETFDGLPAGRVAYIASVAS